MDVFTRVDKYMVKSKISIIIPIYNVESDLPRCVESVLSQSYSNIEAILVDDGSTDDCSSMCDSYKIMDARVRVIHKSNGGLSSARNAGLRLASGEWIMYVDSDDYILEDSCERLLTTAERFNCDIVSADAIRVFDDEQEPMEHSSLVSGKCYPSREYILQAINNDEWYAPAWLNLYKRTFLVKNELYFSEGLLHEDMEMQPRVFLAAKSIAYCAYPFYRYVNRVTSIMNASKLDERASALEQIYSGWKARFETVNDAALSKVLNGYLAKCYLHSCCDLGRVLAVSGVTRSFLIKNSLNVKELIKVVLFVLKPSAYLMIGRQ